MPLPLLALLALAGAGTAATGAATGAVRRSGKTRNPLEDQEDANVIDQGSDGAFMSVLEAIGRPGKAINNALVGNFEGAGRQVVDLLGDVVDAQLPGDWIDHISRRQDKPEFSDVVGGMEPGLAKFAVDVVGGAATDPTTFIPGAAVGKVLGAGGKLAGKGLAVADKFAPGTSAAVGKFGHGVRKTFAALKPTKKVAEDVAEAKAVGGTTRQAAQEYPAEAFKGIDPVVQRRTVEMLRGVSSEMGPGYADLGVAPTSKFVTKPHQMQLLDERLAKMPWPDAEKDAVRQSAERVVDYTRGQFSQGVADDVFGLPDDISATSSMATRQLEQAPADYFPGRFDLAQSAGLPAAQAPSPSMLKAKSLTNPTELSEHLSRTGSQLDTDVPGVLGEYGEQMGRASQSAAIGKKTVGAGFRALTDEPSRAAMSQAIDGLRQAGDLDSAHVLETTFKGLAPPGKFVQTLAKLNKPFKAAATGGILVPRLNFTAGNVMSAVWQAFSNPESRAQTGKTLMRVLPTVFGSIGDGLKQLGIASIPESKAALVARAARESGGTRHGMMARITDNRLRAAVEHGVLDGGFVNTEQLMANAAAQGKGAKSLQNWLYWPQAIMKGSEQRLRYGMFDDIATANIKAGMPEAQAYKEAARITSDTLLDYDVVSAENRAARGGFPFLQFVAKTVPQQAKLMAEQPAVAGTISRAVSGDPEPIYPYMEGKLNIPVGEDETGNDQYLSSLRLPFESLGAIPNLSSSPQAMGKDVARNVVGASHPLLKTIFSAVAGEDPFFDTPFGSYSKLPGNIEGGEAGRLYNMLAGTGLIQPVASIANTAGKFADDRTSAGEKALSLLTGAKLQSVDTDLAMQQQLTEALAANPNVRQHRSFYAQDGDDTTDQLIRAYLEAKARVKAKRQARSP